MAQHLQQLTPYLKLPVLPRLDSSNATEYVSALYGSFLGSDEFRKFFRPLPSKSTPPVIPAPMAMQLDPMAMQLDPMAMQLDPMAMQLDPMAMQLDPMAMLLNPMVMQPDPAAMHPNPMDLQLDPLAMLHDPKATQLQPTGNPIQQPSASKFYVLCVLMS